MLCFDQREDHSLTKLVGISLRGNVGQMFDSSTIHYCVSELQQWWSHPVDINLCCCAQWALSVCITTLAIHTNTQIHKMHVYFYLLGIMHLKKHISSHTICTVSLYTVSDTVDMVSLICSLFLFSYNTHTNSSSAPHSLPLLDHSVKLTCTSYYIQTLKARPNQYIM